MQRIYKREELEKMKRPALGAICKKLQIKQKGTAGTRRVFYIADCIEQSAHRANNNKANERREERRKETDTKSEYLYIIDLF